MNNKEIIADFKKAQKILEEEIISGILNYLNNGIFPKNKSNSFMNAYFIVQTLTDSGDKASADLLFYHNSIIRNFIIQYYNKLSNESDNLMKFLEYTEKIYTLIYWMNKIFSYLDRFYTKAKTKISLGKGSLNLYKKNFFDNFQDDVFKEVNKLIKLDRSGNREFRVTIKKIMKIIRDLDLEEPIIMKEKNKIFWIGDNNTGEKKNPIIQNAWYEKYFQNDTIKFAENKAKTEIDKKTPVYVSLQLKYLDEEYERQREFIGPKYKDRINEINYLYLIGKVSKELVKKDSGIKKMLGDKKNGQLIDQLSNLYKLFKLYPTSLNEIKDEFKNYIEKRGQKLNEDKELSKNPKLFIPELISLNKEIDNLVKNCFENISIFTDVKNAAFKAFMKKDFYPRQLSNYVDICLRKGFKGKSKEEIENTLNDIINLFKYLESKLLFRTESDKKMSDRLIKRTYLSLDTEQLFISKLGQEEGITYINKMKEMMNDLDKNKKETDNYKLLVHKGYPNGIKLDVTVVSQSAWDINENYMRKFELPKSLSYSLEDFEKYYLKRHKEHKLIWCLGLSTLEIQYLYLQKISTSTLVQFLCLLQIEKKIKINIGKLAENLGLKVNEIMNDIHGFIFNPSFNNNGQPDKGVIIKVSNSKSREFKEADEITINKNFISQRIKFNTMPLTRKKTENEIKEEEDKDNIIQQKYKDNIIQATITRIMKSRIGQVNTHSWLVSETTRQISLFVAQPPVIKASIEKLIEKNIIKRSQKKSDCYEYIA